MSLKYGKQEVLKETWNLKMKKEEISKEESYEDDEEKEEPEEFDNYD